MARVVVTGGCGFVGSHLVERLALQGDAVTVYDPAPPSPGLRWNPASVRHVAGDVRDERALAVAITPGVDIVYHLSGIVGVDRYLDDPLSVIDVTVLGTRNVLRAAAAAGTKVVVASTSEVYGRNPRAPWSEDSDRVLGSTAAERWSYSSSKATAEHMTFAFARRLGLPASIIRYFNVYGPRQRPAYVLSKAVHRALRGRPPLLYDGGAQTRCFTFVDDAIEATVRAGANPAADGRCFNVGGDQEVSIAEAVELVISLAGSQVRPVAVETGPAFGAGYEDIPRRVPDTSRARELLGWRCTTPLDEGLRRTIAWARENPWWLEAPRRDDAGFGREHIEGGGRRDARTGTR